MSWYMLIEVLGGLGIFLYGMRIMSRGLESVGGDRMRKWLQKITTNPLAGVSTGIAVTCLVQSSSATTVMLVGLVHAGFLNLTQAAGVIMGANIGTTFTGWLVALLGFKVKITKFALPAIAFGVFLIFIGKGRKRGLWGEILVGFGFLFLGLMFMKDAVGPLRTDPMVRDFMATFSAKEGFVYMLLAVGVGTACTVMIQSSSATMGLTMILAQQGVIDFPTALALILGENIGTTITANLAAIGTDVTAKRSARLHFLFNIFGVIWALVLFTPFTSLVDYLIAGDPYTDVNAIPTHMATFHSIFNITNSLIFLPFIGMLANLATKMVPGKEEEYRNIRYIQSHMISTPSLALGAVRQELEIMVKKSRKMFKTVMELFDKPEESSRQIVEQINAEEAGIDALERDITEYLTHVSHNELSEEASREVSICMNIAHDLERIGDHCENLLKLLNRKYENDLPFSEEATEQIHEIAGEVRKFLDLLTENILESKEAFMEQAQALEDKIDDLRSQLKQDHIYRLSEGKCDVRAGLVFIDMLTSFERIGDHSYNIAQNLSTAPTRGEDEAEEEE